MLNPSFAVHDIRQAPFAPERFKVYTARQLAQIAQLQKLPEEQRFEMRVVANVLPFRVNQYVIDQLIDWSAVPNDPIFQLTFPQRGMLKPEHFDRVAQAMRDEVEPAQLNQIIAEVRAELNPHPAGQLEDNIPQLDGEPIQGLQHKYRETVLFFPSSGQVCYSYCTFCFRRPLFVGDMDLKFAMKETSLLHEYLRSQPQMTYVLVTRGDHPLMKIRTL